jgi:hypothetical protein
MESRIHHADAPIAKQHGAAGTGSVDTLTTNTKAGGYWV